jgi:N utilization substance protein A
MKLNLELIQYINLFEKITRTKVKNCFFHKEKLVFIVANGQGRKAVGKKAFNVQKITKLINKKIKIVEYNVDPVKFINSFVSPIDVENVEFIDNVINLRVKTAKDKGLLIGRNGQNLENIKKIMDYYFKIKEIKVL